jgi:hypothetical protein
MSNPNKHIENYLDEYLKMKSPGFAVMVSGPWGCGKTYFIKDYMEEERAQKICYISLYGVKDIDEIDRRIFLALHPKLDGDYTDLVTHTFNGALTLIKGDKVLSKLKFKDFIHAAKDRALVFDDLERCPLEKKNVMGYINAFVEHKNNHVVIIANEEEIAKQELTDGEDAKKRSAYARVKEKLIGKTFTIDSNIRNVLPSIIKVVDDKNCAKILMKNQPLLIDIFNAAQEAYKEHNYRAFTNTLRDFEWFISNLQKEYVKHESLMRDLLHFFVAVGYELQLNKISPKDIRTLENHSIAFLRKKKEQTPIDELLERQSIGSDNTILDSELWAQTFENKMVLKKDLNDALANSKYFYQEKAKEDFVTLWHWRDQEDDVAHNIIDTVFQGLEEHKYRVPGEILHIFGSLLRMSKDNVIDQSVPEIVALATGYIEHLGEIHGFNIPSDKPRFFDDLIQFGHGHLGYTEEKSEEFKQLGNLLINTIKMNIRSKKVAEIPDILSALVEDTHGTCMRLVEGDLSAIDLFKSIDPADFLETFMRIPNVNKKEIAFMLKNRYRGMSPALDSVLRNEHEFLLELDKLAEEKIKGSDKITPSLEQLRLTRGSYLSAAIESTRPAEMTTKPEADNTEPTTES